MSELTPTEKKAIAALKRVAKIWPDSLWLYSASGTLTVMRAGDGGEQVATSRGGFDPDYIVTSIEGISNDGGDW